MKPRSLQPARGFSQQKNLEMAPMSRGKKRKASDSVFRSAPNRRRVASSSGSTTKNHRFEPFTERVARIKIKPVRPGARGREHRDLADNASHFRTALDSWRDRVLAESFTVLARQVDPVTQSLAQLLHHSASIIDMLLEALVDADVHSLEPLLDLITCMSYDLGSRFEPFFDRTTSAVAAVATNRTELEAVEWSFNTIAAMLRHLQRILAQDLSRAYRLLAPLLGRQRQRPFVSRFAAEALSFLIRKSSSGGVSAQSPDSFVTILKDLASDKSDDLHLLQQSVSFMFAESMRGPNLSIQTNAPITLRAIIRAAGDLLSEQPPSSPDLAASLIDVVEGIVISVIHHTDAAGFHPALNVLLDEVRVSTDSPTSNMTALQVTLLRTAVATRKGSRMSTGSDRDEAWTTALDRVNEYMALITDRDLAHGELSSLVLECFGACLLYCPSTMLSRVRSMATTLVQSPLKPHFLWLCMYTQTLNAERFNVALRSLLQEYTSANWTREKDELLSLLPQMANASAIFNGLMDSEACCSDIMSTFKRLASTLRGSVEPDSNDTATASHLLTLIRQERIHFKHSDELRGLLNEIFCRATARVQQQETSELTDFAFTTCLQALVEMREESLFSKSDSLESLFGAAQQYSRSPLFLKALLAVLSAQPREAEQCQELVKRLTENLQTPSHDVRSLSLQVLHHIASQSPGSNDDLWTLASTIEDTPAGFETQRNISMNIRRLPTTINAQTLPEWTKKAMISLLFGLLHVRLAPIWADVCDAMRTLCGQGPNEQAILDCAASWVNQYHPRDDLATPSVIHHSTPRKGNDFECSNLSLVKDTAASSREVLNDTRTTLRSDAANMTKCHSLSAPSNRAQGLRVLNALPSLAEKRSRAIVPIFLDWFQEHDGREETDIFLESDDDTLPSPVSPPPDKKSNAGREDKKSFLRLFGSFSNPTVLFKSAEVHSILLSLLSQGNVDFQRLALQAILTWKSPQLTPYGSNLLNLLDEARFRDELAVFLSTDEEASIIRAEHLPQLLPVAIRILYGRVISREGTKNRGGQDARRKAVLVALSRFGHDALAQFIAIAVEPLEELNILLTTDKPQIDEDKMRAFKLPVRKQLGMMRMVHQILVSLANLTGPFAKTLVDAILFCGIHSSRKLEKHHQIAAHSADGAPPETSLLRSTRHEALSCLNRLFENSPDYPWQGHASVIFWEMIEPRLSKLPIETAQGVSATLRLLSTWAGNPQTIPMVLSSGTSIFDVLTQCLDEPSARDEVKLFVMRDILERGLATLESCDDKAQFGIEECDRLLRGGAAELGLRTVSKLLGATGARDMVEACVSLIIRLAPHTQESSSRESLVETCLQILDSGNSRASPKTKSEVLALLLEYLPKSNLESSVQFCRKMSDRLCPLFSFFLDGRSRDRLAKIFGMLAETVEDLREPGRLCTQLNSFSGSRLNQPDFDRRMDAFDAINGLQDQGLSAFQWHPIVHNMLFLLRDDGEFSSTRLNAADGLRRFVRIADTQYDSDAQFSAILHDELLPIVIKGIREPSEIIRQEYLSVLEELVLRDHANLADLRCLTAADGESFFTKVLHIQHHQRIQGLRLLVQQAHLLTSKSVSKVILPLLETMLAQTDEGTQNLADEIIKTMQKISACLDWEKYRFTVQRMVSERARFESKKGLRTVNAMISGLTLAAKQSTQGSADRSTLSTSLPGPNEIHGYFSKGTLAKLLDFVHFKDEAVVDLRVLATEAVVAMIMTFPEEKVSELLPPVLMDASSVLRSKAQEARDSVRGLLSDVAVSIGPPYFGFLIKQLKTALKHGNQLHVLSYTVHAILLSVSTSFKPGAIDQCIYDVMQIILDDVFGVVAQDKESEGLRSKMKEVRKKALGYDSLELLTTLIVPESTILVINPIFEHLSKPKVRLDKIDELFRRIREGMRRNSEFADQRTLNLCFELHRKALASEDGRKLATDPRRYKTATFASDLTRRILDKHEHLKTSETVGPFIPLAIQILNEGEEDSQVAAMKLLTSVIKLPLNVLDESAGQFLGFATGVLEAETSTSSNLAQAALRLSASVLRERPNAVLQKADFTKHVAYMLTRIKPDFHEPAQSHERGRQVGAFNLLKASLGRGVILNEVYDVMDTVREVMVTSPESEIRSSARAVFSRFILDYFPKGGKAFDKQVAFLRKNLQYSQPDGRQSVMEVVDYILTKSKSNTGTVQSIVTKFWNAVLDLVVTDADAASRGSAKILLQKLFAVSDDESSSEIKKQLLLFCDQEMPDVLQRAGFNGMTTFFEARPIHDQDLADVVPMIDSKLEDLRGDMKRGKAMLTSDSLSLLKVLCSEVPRKLLAEQNSPLWDRVMRAGTASEQPAIRLSCIQLVNMLLIDLVKTEQVGAAKSHYVCSGGLQVKNAALTHLVDSAVAVFGIDHDEGEIGQAAQSLRLVARLPDDSTSGSKTGQIMARLAGSIRQESTAGLRPKLAALQLFRAIQRDGPKSATEFALETSMLTLSNVIDGGLAVPIGEESTRDQLVDAARETLSELRETVGSEVFVKKMQEVQTAITERREDRRAKRRIEAVTKPEEAERRKVKKSEANKARRKERNEMHAGRRRGY